MRLPILFLDQFGTFGGGQRVLWEILQSLDPSRFTPIVALNGKGDFRERVAKAGFLTEDLAIGNYRSGKKSMSDSIRFLGRTLFSALRLASLVRQRNVKLLYANGPRTFACAAIAGRITGRPVIWHLHNVLPEGAELKWLICFARWVRQILACSQAVAQPLLRAKPEFTSKVTIVYNPIPRWVHSSRRHGLAAPTTTCKEPRQSLNVGILGRVTPFKGQLQFAEAARIVLEKFRKAHFWIIGGPAEGSAQDAAYLEEVRGLIKHYGMEQQFSFVAHQQDVAPYYDLLDIVVVASQGPEAFPMTVLEAMALGKPVVVSHAGGIAELVETDKTALVVPEASPEALAKGIRELLANAAKRQWLGENASTVARERFPMRAFEEMIQQVLDSALLGA
jgi:glycosyltransferase involved in cell wall biosynthesis